METFVQNHPFLSVLIVFVILAIILFALIFYVYENDDTLKQLDQDEFKDNFRNWE